MSDFVTIRTATPGDAAAAERVYRHSFPVLMAGAYEGEILARVLPLFTRANPVLLASGTYYLGELGAEVVGCGGWSMEDPATRSIMPGIAHIRHFATAAEWTGKGVGRALYRQCERDARARGVRAFECYASRNGEPFYATLGFERVSEIGLKLAPDLEIACIRMRRDLPPA
jgi:GNAT superfamily N-acetyltransferase